MFKNTTGGTASETTVAPATLTHRWNEIGTWMRRAEALGLADVSDALFCERLDAIGDSAAYESLVSRARAACLLHAFQACLDEVA